MDNRFGEQIGLPGNHFLKQQMQESGLEMSLEPFTIAMGIATVAGAGISAFGNYQASQAAQSAANQSAEAAKEMADYQWGETKNRESYNQHTVDINRINEENLRNFTDQQNLDKHNRELYIRDFDYKSQVEEYNKTEQQYAQQIDYNAMSATLARDEQTLWLEEQLQQAAFDTEGLIIDTFNKQRLSRDKFSFTREDLTLKERSKRAEFTEKAMEGWNQKLQAEGKVRALGQAGRTGRKNKQSVLAMSGQMQAMLNSMVTRSDLSFELEHLKNQQAYSNESDFISKQFSLGKRKTESTIDSAYAQNKANLLRIEHDNYGADMAADNQRLAPPPAYEDLPPITAPYYTPETHIADAYKTEKKPPGPVGAPDLMAGAGLQAAGTVISGMSKAAAMYEPSTPATTGSTGSTGGFTYGEGGHSFSGGSGYMGNSQYI